MATPRRSPAACSNARAAIAATFLSTSVGIRSASRPVTETIRDGSAVSSTVTVSPIPSTASPRTSNPGPTFPTVAGANTVAICFFNSASRLAWRVASRHPVGQMSGAASYAKLPRTTYDQSSESVGSFETQRPGRGVGATSSSELCLGDGLLSLEPTGCGRGAPGGVLQGPQRSSGLWWQSDGEDLAVWRDSQYRCRPSSSPAPRGDAGASLVRPARSPGNRSRRGRATGAGAAARADCRCAQAIGAEAARSAGIGFLPEYDDRGVRRSDGRVHRKRARSLRSRQTADSRAARRGGNRVNEQDQEKRLRALLDEAHRADRPPAFRRTWEAARVGNRPRRALWMAVPALAAVALLLVWTARFQVGPTRPSEQIPSLEWNGPLDFLLQTPGSELLNTVPTFNAARSLP